ncbi:MAG: InlB B-repeat-containing protein [Oscillospiraceae bacterium]|nr:InlB B-repeat-containing protein [Oscillospiraceae bacterium]
MNKFDILTEKLIKIGKSHNLLRIPMFIAIMALVLAEGVYELARKAYRFLFKKRFLSKALSFAVAWFMFAPFYQPAVIFAMEETSVSEPSQTETEEETDPEETTSEETTSGETNSEETTSGETNSEETTSSESSSEETTSEGTSSSSSDTEISESSPSSDSDNTDTTPTVSDSSPETEVPEGDPSETESSSVTPSETELPETTEMPPMMMAVPPDENTVYISTADQLYYFLSNLDPNGNPMVDAEGNATDNSAKNVVLTADIDCSTCTLGTRLPQMKTYNGTFDGRGYVIKNATFSGTACWSSGRQYCGDAYGTFYGMFFTLNGTVMNLGFDTVVSSHGTVGGYNHAALVAHTVSSTGAIKNCFAVNSTIMASEISYFKYFGSGSVLNSYIGGCSIVQKDHLYTDGSSVFATPADCTDDKMEILNQNNTGATWYKGTSPDYTKNYGYPTTEETIPVVFYKDENENEFSSSPVNELLFKCEFDEDGNIKDGTQKATQSTYSIVEGSKLYLPDNIDYLNNGIVMPKHTFGGWKINGETVLEVKYDTEGQLDTEANKNQYYTIKSSDISDGKVEVYAIWNRALSYRLVFVDQSDDEINITPPINAGSPLSDEMIGMVPASDPAHPEKGLSAADLGYEFVGWCRYNPATREYISEEPWDFWSDTPSKAGKDEDIYNDDGEATITLKELFRPIEYTITLDLNGGTLENYEDTINYNVTTPNVTLPTAPKKTGYHFRGWEVTVSDDTTAIPLGNISVLNPSTDKKLANITVKAKWEAIKYKIAYNKNADTYVTNGNSIEMSEHQFDSVAGDTATRLSANTFTRDHYTFIGWAKERHGEKVFDDKAEITENLADEEGEIVTLYAVWQPVEYDITYVNAENGTCPSIDTVETTYTVIENSNVKKYTADMLSIELKDITCKGYELTNIQCTGGTVSTVNGKYVITIPAGDSFPTSLTITGEWEPITYTVEFDRNGGIWKNNYSANLINKEYNIITGYDNLPTDYIERKYYQFLGWNVNFDTDCSALTEVTEIPKGSYGNATATAVWDPVDFNIDVDLDGGTIAKSIPSTYNNETVFDLGCTPIKEGHTFTGWEIVADGFDNNGNFPEEPVIDFVINNNFGDVKLTATFKINQYTISFDTDGGSEIPSEVQDFDTLINEPDEIPVKEGYNFVGWYDEDGNEFLFDENAKVPDEDITIYAKWEIQTFDVVFETNGGSTVETQVVEYGNTAERPQNPTKPDNGNKKYHFLGWFSDEGCTNIFNFSTPIKESKTVYAKWVEYTEAAPLKLYNVSYKTSDDSEEAFSIGNFANGEQIILPSVPDDIINHKVFKGFIIKDDASVIYNANDVFTINGIDDEEGNPLPVILVAVWDVERHTVTFLDDDGETEIAPKQEIEYNKRATAPSPEKRGFIFKGWFAEDGSEFSFDTQITIDIVLKAKWEEVIIPETPSRPGSSGSSGVKYDKTIRITELPDGITAPAELFKATADMDDFKSSVDVRITNASESAEDELKRLLRLHTDIPDEDIFIFDISLYERGTDRKITLPTDTLVSLTVPVCDKFTTNLEKVRVVSVHNGKLVIYPEPYMSVSEGYILVNFSSDKFSTFAFVLDRDNQITDLSASAPSAIAAEMMLYAPPAIMPAISGVIVNGKTKLRISRKRKIYKVLRKFH